MSDATAPAPNVSPALLAPADYDHFRALLRSPEIVAAQQATLDRQAAKLPQVCPTMHFIADSIDIRQPLRFGVGGGLVAGRLRYRWRGTGCSADPVLINLWITARDGTVPSVAAGLPGTSIASTLMQRDFFASATAAVTVRIPGCSRLDIVDTRFRGYLGRSDQARPGDDPRIWQEEWLVAGCGHRAVVPIRFVPDSTGTSGFIEQQAVRLLN